MPTTEKGVPYPSPGAPNNVPADLYALAAWVNDHFGGDSFTTAERDALPPEQLWDGRLIRNTTTGDLEVYDLAADAWLTVIVSAGAQDLADKTLLKPTIAAPRERVTVLPGGMGATVNFDVLEQGVRLYAGDATANSTLNVRGDASTALDDVLAVGDSVTVVLLVTNGGTGYRPSAFQVDGSPVTPSWAGGVAPSIGNADAIDAWTYTIIKTAADTYTVLAATGKYA